MNSNAIKTPFPRLITGISIGSFGYNLALITPIAFLLTVKLAMLDPANVTKNFSIIGLTTGIIGIFSQYLAGVISDRTTWKLGRRRPWILIGSIGGAAALYGVGSAKSFTVVLLFWALAKLLLSFMSTALTALIPDQVPENKRGTASGIYGLVSPLAIMFGINLMFILNSLAIEKKFLLLGMICVVFAIITSLLIKEDKVEYQKERGNNNALSFGEKMSRIYPSPRKYPNFTFGMLTRFFMGIAYTASSFTSVYYLERFHVSQQDLAGIVSTSMNITIPILAIASIIGGSLSDKFGRQKPFVFLAAVVTAVGILGYGFAPSIGISYVCGSIISLGFGMFLAVDIALMSRVLPHPEDAAKDMGIVNIANDIGGSLANSAASPIVAAGGYPLFFGVLAVFGILAGIMVKPIPELERNDPANIELAQ
ncbi:MFS transporter [Neobacillus drentensis]|uniref:MFS transporter n=1 Tax=Neobacillus drentensis TaxID=220684 RepID=UPI001F471CD6|nr:MFS transporter [Neobacillus drentensis]ULT58257.1 MFS transporter [Neobacillus drentensis]